MKRRKINDILYDNSIDIRDRVFIMNIINLVVILTLTTLEILSIKDLRMESLNSVVMILVFIFIGLYSARTKHFEFGSTLTTFVLGFIYWPVTFINAGGVSGVGTLWFVFCMFFIGTTLSGKKRVIFFIAQELEAIFMFLFTFYNPEVLPSFDSLRLYIYSFTTLVLISSAIVIMISFENKLYIEADKIAKQQNEEIEGLNQAQNRFFSSMSHEIRTPINTIIGLNEMILREDISDEVASDAVNIRVAGKLLLNLINDILDMSKFQAGDMRLLVEPYSPGNMLSDLVGMLWIRAKEKNLEFSVNVAPDIPAELMGDEVRIKQILMNILNNAIKYTKEGSISLSVECEAQEDGVYNIIYTVSDTGMGIKKEDIPYLFTAFKRVDESNTKHIEGTGLGLSIVKQFLDLMGGKVTVNSVYTKGSTFIVEIPQKATTDKQIGEYDYEKKHKLGKRTNYKQKFEAPKAKLLVVDDNEANILVVTKLLRDTKVQIDTAKSGMEALEKTLENKYDLIFMDHLMPEMDGIECYEKIREQTGGKSRESKIVILTANAGEENRQLYADTGFDGYLVKPISGEELENEVYRHLPREIVNVVGDSDEIAQETVSWMKSDKKKKRIAITTDSIADLPEEVIKKYDIVTIPHKVRTDAGTFKDGIEINTAGVLAYLKNTDKTMLPLSPDVSEHENFFADQLTIANNVIHIAVSKDIENSGYESALEAANSFENVTVVNSEHLSSGQGLMAAYASRLASAGMSIPDIIDRLEVMKKCTHTSFMVDTLDYLARANQVSARRANLVRAFMVRPVVVMKNGVMKIGRVYIGERENSWKKYIDHCLATPHLNTTMIIVTYVGLTKKELEWIRKRIERKVNFDTLYFQEASPAIAVNCGPGTFGLLLFSNPE